MKKIIYSTLAFVLLIFLVSACTKDFVEINTNPNEPTAVPLESHLAGTIIDFDGSMAFSNNNIQISVLYVGNRWRTRSETVSNTYQGITSEGWGFYYNNLVDINDIIAKATEAEKYNMLAAALTFRAEMTQIATDLWGEMPYSEACRAGEELFRPVYDSQASIYAEIIKDLKTAADLFKEGHNDPIGTVEPFYKGDVSKWQKLCNTLRLRVAVRISNVDEAGATAIISEVLGSPSDYPVSENVDDKAEVTYAGNDTWQIGYWYWNDLLSHSGGGKRLVDMLNGYNDPRTERILAPAISDGAYRGSLRIGRDPALETEDISYWNRNYYLTNGTTGPNIHFRHSELCFLKAEIYARGLFDGGDAAAKTAYDEGVYSSMKEMSIMVDGTPQIADDVIAAYLADPATSWSGTDDEKLEKLWNQKYLAMTFMAYEPWAEMRRTDTPLCLPELGSYYDGHNRGPFRVPYPSDEALMNSENSKEYFDRQLKGDYSWGGQMWWDTRTGVN